MIRIAVLLSLIYVGSSFAQTHKDLNKQQKVQNKIIPYKKHYLSLITQNDGYINPMIDQYYTAGNALLYASSEGNYEGLDSFGFIQGTTSFSLALSQLLYAPKAKFAIFPPSDDHPYAGFLSLTFGIHHRSENMLESLGLRLGVSGKFSYGQAVQDKIHTLLGVGLARGWGTQIGNEIIINAYYELVYKHLLYKSAYFDIDILPSLEFALGNVNIYAKLNTFLRLGYNLSSTFLSQGMNGENGGMQAGRVYADGVGFFVFFGLGGAYVARKMAINGNFFGTDSYPRAVNLSNWVGNFEAGISLVSGTLSLTYKTIYVSKEFKEQDKLHSIGSISIAYSF